jgi:hypothetical protein
MPFENRCTFGHHVIIDGLLEESSQFLHRRRVRLQTFKPRVTLTGFARAQALEGHIQIF